MDDICYPHFALQACPMGPLCSCAHDFSQLSNPDQWVIFKARNFIMLNFIAEKYRRHQTFKHYSLAGYGSLIRCPTADDAKAVLQEYGKYCNPQSLREYIERSVAKKNWADSHPPSKLGLWDKGGSDCEEDEVWRKPAQNKGEPKQGKENKLVKSKTPSKKPAEEVVLQDLAARGVNGWLVKELEARVAKDLAARGITTQPDTGSSSSSTHSSNGSEKTPSGKGDKVQHCSLQVLEILKANVGAGRPRSAGWEALEKVWGIREDDLDDAVLMYLRTKSPQQQEHILLTFAAIGLESVNNLSAYLNCLIREHETTTQVCIHFFAGVCKNPHCEYIHPIGTKGWNLLEQTWGITYKDFDYAVLNYLSKKPLAQQDDILISFASMNLKMVNNLSAYLSTVVQKFEKNEQRGSSGRSSFQHTSHTEDVRAMTSGFNFPDPNSLGIGNGYALRSNVIKLDQIAKDETPIPRDLSAYTMYLLPANSHINAYAGPHNYFPIIN